MAFKVVTPSSSIPIPSDRPPRLPPFIKGEDLSAFNDAGHGEAGIGETDGEALGVFASDLAGERGASIVGPPARGDTLWGISTFGGLALSNGPSA